MTALGGPPPGYAGPPIGSPPGYGSSPPPGSARMSPIAIVAVFVGVLMGLALVAAVVVLLSAPPPPVAQCQPGQPCSDPPASLPPVADATAPPSGAPPSTVRPSAPPVSPSPSALPTTAPASPEPTETPTSDSPPAVSGTLWRDDSLSYSFEYDDRVFTLSQSDDGLAVLDGNFFDTQVVIRAVPAATSPGQLIDEQLSRVDRFLIGRVPDTDPYDALLGPSIGYIRGEGGVFSGTLVSQDGTPLAPGGVTIVASTDGRITVAVLAIVGTPDVLLGSDTHQNAVRSAADEILKTFDWDDR